jgi:hypothetical protein
MASSTIGGFFQKSTSNQLILNDASADDMILRTATSNQRLLLSSGSNVSSTIAIQSSNIGIRLANPQYGLDINAPINYRMPLYSNGVQVFPWKGVQGQYLHTDETIGIGTSMPDVTKSLDIVGDVAIRGLLWDSVAGVVGHWSRSSDSNALVYGTLGNKRVGVGTTSPQYKLDVVGDINCSGAIRINGSSIVPEGGSILRVDAFQRIAWDERDRLQPATPIAASHFGQSLSSDLYGTVIAAPTPDTVTIFTRSSETGSPNTLWSRSATLTADLGTQPSVCLSPDGLVLASGNPSDYRIHFWDRPTLDSSDWTYRPAYILADVAGQAFGRHVFFSSTVADNKYYLLVTDPLHPRIRIYYGNTTTGWSVTQTIATAFQISHASIEGTGSIISLSCASTSTVYVYRRTGTGAGASWSHEETIQGTEGSEFGTAICLANNYLVVGAPNELTDAGQSGAVYVYKKETGTWKSSERQLLAPMIKSGERLGCSVAIDGAAQAYVVAGSSYENVGAICMWAQEGQTHIWDWVGSEMPMNHALHCGFSYTPSSLAIGYHSAGPLLAVGAPYLHTSVLQGGAIHWMIGRTAMWYYDSSSNVSVLARGVDAARIEAPLEVQVSTSIEKPEPTVRVMGTQSANLSGVSFHPYADPHEYMGAIGFLSNATVLRTTNRTSGGFDWSVTATEEPVMRLTGTGSLVIGPQALAPSPSNSIKLYVQGDIYHAGSLTGSDERIKENIRDVSTSEALSRILQLKLKHYALKEDGVDTIGLLAQQVETAIPEAVKRVRMAIPSIRQRATVVAQTSETTKLQWVNSYPDPYPTDAIGKTWRIGSDEYLVVKVEDDGVIVSGGTTSLCGEVYVYGEVVDDFATMDYSKVFMYLIGAIQEINSALLMGAREK